MCLVASAAAHRRLEVVLRSAKSFGTVLGPEVGVWRKMETTMERRNNKAGVDVLEVSLLRRPVRPVDRCPRVSPLTRRNSSLMPGTKAINAVNASPAHRQLALPLLQVDPQVRMPA